MKKVLKNITTNWFVFVGYLSLCLLTFIAALQIYEANYKIADKYKDLAHKTNTKLSLLLKCREDLELVQTITIDKVFHPSEIANNGELKLNELLEENNNNLARYRQFLENGEKDAFNKLELAWEQDKKTSMALIGFKTDQQQAIRYYRSIQQKSYDDLQKAISSLSTVLVNEIGVKEVAATAYFKRSIALINMLIGIRVAILIAIGIIILKVVARLRTKNKILLETHARLSQNEAHLLASQRISKTGSWELHLDQSNPLIDSSVTWSDETCRIFGYEPGEAQVSNELFFSHVPEDDRPRILTAVQKSIETGIPYDIEHRIILRNGETKIVYERSDIFYDSNGKPEKMIGTCQDITDRKHAEQKLAEAIKEKHYLTDQINKQKINRQKEITRATIKAQEKERLELGRELHDNVNQILSSSKLFIENAVHNPDKQEEMLNRSKNLINSCIEELRKLSRFLTPPTLGDLTLRESIEEIVDEYNQIDGKKTVEHMISHLDEDKLSDDLKISLYRIIQEQLNNIRKHARASKVYIRLRHGNNKIALDIEDNGCGFDINAKRKGLGITNIINRAETFNGGVQIISSPGRGCSIYINFQLSTVSMIKIPDFEEATEKFYGTGS